MPLECHITPDERHARLVRCHIPTGRVPRHAGQCHIPPDGCHTTLSQCHIPASRVPRHAGRVPPHAGLAPPTPGRCRATLSRCHIPPAGYRATPGRCRSHRADAAPRWGGNWLGSDDSDSTVSKDPACRGLHRFESPTSLRASPIRRTSSSPGNAHPVPADDPAGALTIHQARQPQSAAGGGHEAPPPTTQHPQPNTPNPTATTQQTTAKHPRQPRIRKDPDGHIHRQLQMPPSRTAPQAQAPPARRTPSRLRIAYPDPVR
jgi:hypothetical protein